jgi:hypothetical protein
MRRNDWSPSPECAVWPHKEGPGFNEDIEAIPVNFEGRLILLPPRRPNGKPGETFEEEAAQI